MKNDWNEIPESRGNPDFNNLLAVLQCKEPSRPTLFEFFLNERLYSRLAPELDNPTNDLDASRRLMTSFLRAGYDYANVPVPGFSFLNGIVTHRKERSVSQNEGSVLHNRADFKTFRWPDPDQANYGVLDDLGKEMPAGMKLIVFGPDGVLENATELVGYEALCMMILDDEKLASDVFAEVGSRLERYYEIAAKNPFVGACISNDDWGFKTQTQFSPKDMRRFVFPWHKRIVAAIHKVGKPVILHSCGHFQRVIDDVIDDMKYDGRHSYEDAIMPVEEFYEAYHNRIAVLGGIDLDFVCRASPEEVYTRSKAMLARAEGRGGFALGTGNSVPDYVPDDHYFAMLQAALDTR